MQQLPFKHNEQTLTLGVEMEIQLLDKDTLLLVPKAPEILHELKHDLLAKEMFRSTLELVTEICDQVDQVKQQLNDTLSEIRQLGGRLNLSFAGTGTNPVANYDERILSESGRYQALLDRNQWLIKRMAVYGLHVHIGMRDGDSCMRFNNFFLHFIPHLIALSASSPFWVGRDTGLAASRPTMYQSHPTSGLPIRVENWSEFNDLYSSLLTTHSIESMKDIWWDLRPSPGYGTLEIRICDGPATMFELTAIVAFIHLLAHWFEDHNQVFFENRSFKPKEWILRENKWRAIRYGLDATIIRYQSLQEERLTESFERWLTDLTPYVHKLGYEQHVEAILEILQRGNSSSRQRKVMQESNDIMQVVKHNIHEFEKGEPIW